MCEVRVCALIFVRACACVQSLYMYTYKSCITFAFIIYLFMYSSILHLTLHSESLHYNLIRTRIIPTTCNQELLAHERRVTCCDTLIPLQLLSVSLVVFEVLTI